MAIRSVLARLIEAPHTAELQRQVSSDADFVVKLLRRKTKENSMSLETILIVVLVVFLLGGGGWFYSRR